MPLPIGVVLVGLGLGAAALGGRSAPIRYGLARFNNQRGRVPAFDGMPDAEALPAGWEVVNVWGNRPTGEFAGGWEPRFDRFRQWTPVFEAQRAGAIMNPDAVAEITADFREAFSKRYAFQVIGGDVGWGLFVLGRPIASRFCCDVASYTGEFCSSNPGGGFTCVQRTARFGQAGPIASPLVCESEAAECWTLLPRPLIDWPEVEPPPIPWTETQIQGTITP